MNYRLKQHLEGLETAQWAVDEAQAAYLEQEQETIRRFCPVQVGEIVEARPHYRTMTGKMLVKSIKIERKPGQPPAWHADGVMMKVNGKPGKWFAEWYQVIE